MKVAIVNRTHFLNYGSVLQCFALCEAVHDLGFESEILWVKGSVVKHFDVRIPKAFAIIKKILLHPSLLSTMRENIAVLSHQEEAMETKVAFETFVQKHIQQKIVPSHQLRMLANSEYHALICGSDQIWCASSLYVDPLMYLRFAPKHKRIAYAPSLGRDSIPSYNTRIMRKYILGIRALSIRETQGALLIDQLTGKKPEVVVDPTLLLDRKRWSSLATPMHNAQPVMVCYFLDTPSEEMQKKIATLAIQQKALVVVFKKRLETLEKMTEASYSNGGPEVFLGAIKNSQYVFTDSYHGMIFSIVFEKPFWSIERQYQTYDQSSRQKSLLSLLDIPERYIQHADTITLQPLSYVTINKKLALQRTKSLTYLKEALKLNESDR